MNDGIIIQARTGSTRLPAKILLPFYGEQRIIDILIENIRRACPDKKLILATTVREQDDVLEQVAREHGILCYRGSEENVLDRFIGAARTHGLNRFIRVCSDNPFLQAESFGRLFSEHDARPEADYVSYAFADGRPTIKSHLGLYAELTTLTALERVASLTQEKLYIEHVTIYLYTHPETFNVCLLPLPEELEGRTDLRFTLDTPEDFALLQELYRTINDERLIINNFAPRSTFIAPRSSLAGLLALVEAHPEYRAKMLENIAKNEK